MNIQTITLDGKSFVVVPKEDYLDLKDTAEAKVISARIKSGEEETFPSEVVEALVEGGNPVRVFRKHRGMTMVELAAKADISQPYLSEIENGKKEGSVSALKKIASALGLDLDDIV